MPLRDPRSQAFLFARGDTPLVGLYSLDDRLRMLRPTGVDASRLRVFDAMGNRISTPDEGIPYGPTPVYIVGRGTTVAALRRALRGGLIAERRDRDAPALTIDQAPRGPVKASTLRVRWSATDAVSLPSHAKPNAITYSHRLLGPGRTGAWSRWTQSSAAELTALSQGRYRLEVRARDAAGNLSATVSRRLDVR